MGEKFRVLVVDDDRGFRMGAANLIRSQGFEVDEAEGGQEALNMVKSVSYSLVYLDIGLRDSNGLSEILPQMLNADETMQVIMLTANDDAASGATAIKLGAADYIVKGNRDTNHKIVTSATTRLVDSLDVGPLTILKVGGSAQLYVAVIKKDWSYLQRAVDFLKSSRRSGGGLIATTGAGVFGYAQKDFRDGNRSIGDVEGDFDEAMKRCLAHNIINLRSMFGKDFAEYLLPQDFRKVDESFLKEKVALMSLAPSPILRKYRIPLRDSDTQTIATAEFYGAERLIFLKRTDAIYMFDPYLGYDKGIDQWIRTQATNQRIETVYAEDFLNGRIDTVGAVDGRKGHCLEYSAALFFVENTARLKEILVVHIDPENMFPDVLNGRHIIDPTIKKKSLEDQLLGAFNGVAYSRIVKRGD